MANPHIPYFWPSKEYSELLDISSAGMRSEMSGGSGIIIMNLTTSQK